MKKLILILGMIMGSQAFAGSLEVPVEFEVIKADAACNKHSCYVDETTGEEKCRYSVFFEDRSYEAIGELKKEKGYTKTWYQKSPYEMCSNGELPNKGEGFRLIDVMLYKVDLSILTEQF